MIKGFLGGLKFSISGFFWVGRFWQVFFWVFKTNVSIFVLYHFRFFRNFYVKDIWHGILGRLNLGPGIFWVPLEVLGNFFGFDFCPHSNIPVT